mmetsp:Transcript_54931/g.146696  ORF Transcript_54931/g.146696 Transcript_54931/m.146696 type:complete len:234 (-) Transcript_54931:29-730(-)
MTPEALYPSGRRSITAQKIEGSGSRTRLALCALQRADALCRGCGGHCIASERGREGTGRGRNLCCLCCSWLRMLWHSTLGLGNNVSRWSKLTSLLRHWCGKGPQRLGTRLRCPGPVATRRTSWVSRRFPRAIGEVARRTPGTKLTQSVARRSGRGTPSQISENSVHCACECRCTFAGPRGGVPAPLFPWSGPSNHSTLILPRVRRTGPLRSAHGASVLAGHRDATPEGCRSCN